MFIRGPEDKDVSDTEEDILKEPDPKPRVHKGVKNPTQTTSRPDEGLKPSKPSQTTSRSDQGLKVNELYKIVI